MVRSGDRLSEGIRAKIARLFYMTEEAQEGRNAFVEKRKPDFSKFPKRP